MKKILGTILIILFLLTGNIAKADWGGWKPANFWKQVGETLQLWNSDLTVQLDNLEVVNA